MEQLSQLFVYTFLHRSESESSLNSDVTSQLLAMSKLSNGLTSPAPSMTEDKDSNKNNLLLAMLWLQRHRELLNFGQQHSPSALSMPLTSEPKVRH